MIHSLYANDHRFRKITFTKGLNLIVADTKLSSDKKDSRNGTGKTTFINVIHFCLGSDLNRSNLPRQELKDWSFFLEFDLLSEKFIIERKISDPKNIIIDGKISVLPIAPDYDEDKKFYFYELDVWKKLLGLCLFGISNTSRKYQLSFRTLISYFIRNGDGAYSSAFTYFSKQSGWQIQISNSFLLGLNWQYASEIQDLKDNNKSINALKAAAAFGVIETKGELETERLRLKIQYIKHKKALSSFEVHDQYEEIESNANRLTNKIHELTNEIIFADKKLQNYEKSVKVEKVLTEDPILALYEEAGVVFGDEIKKNIKDARKFHSLVIENRKYFLASEIDQIKFDLANYKTEKHEAIEDRARLLSVLDRYGALDEYTRLQERLLGKKGKLDLVLQKIKALTDFNKQKKNNKAKRSLLDSKIQKDYELSRDSWEMAVTKFNENSEALYNQPGKLIINISENSAVDDNGYKFDIDIPRSKSEGIGKMKIYCYDLMLLETLASQGNRIDFLFHDSTLYDGVDARQIAQALEHAHQKGISQNLQYICTFNSDMLPVDQFSKGFDFEEFVKLRISDKTAKDRLLGFEF